MPAAFSRYHFLVLLLVVVVTGLSQGLLLPLLSILLDQAGVSADLNGLNSTALYIGSFGAMFFVEKLVARLGYKNVILGGLIVVMCAMLTFPVTDSLAAWFVLRLLIGVGDSSLHFASQLWIVSASPPERRGRNISLYGMSYGIGFSLGPLGINLLPLGESVPFLVNGVFFAVAAALMLGVPQARPEPAARTAEAENRFVTAYRAWFALIPSLLYGVMEASMNSSFPLYALRIDLNEDWISLLLLAFGMGALALQLPLGMLSDRIGRKPVLIGCSLIGSAAFLAVPAAGSRIWLLFVLFAAAGGVVGSFFSLSLAYAADLLPKAVLPAANLIASIHYSIGSILGPAMGGCGIRYVSDHSMFWFLGFSFLLFALSGFLFRAGKNSPSAFSAQI